MKFLEPCWRSRNGATEAPGMRPDSGFFPFPQGGDDLLFIVEKKENQACRAESQGDKGGASYACFAGKFVLTRPPFMRDGRTRAATDWPIFCMKVRKPKNTPALCAPFLSRIGLGHVADHGVGKDAKDGQRNGRQDDDDIALDIGREGPFA